jgi:hypothetical protein
VRGFYPILEIPRGAMFADLDGNSGIDIGLFIRGRAALSPEPLIFLWNDGTGILADTTHLVTPAWDVEGARAPNDTDADGDVDLFVTDFYRRETYTYTNQDNREFVLASTYETGLGSSAPRVADFNGDGAMDIVVSVFDSNRTKESAKLLFNDGDEEFGTMTVVDNLVDVRFIGDLDGDNDVDIGFHWTIDESLSVYLNDGAGTFSVGGRYFADRYNRGSCLGDFDGDGDLDLVESGVRVFVSGTWPPVVVYQGFYRLVSNDGSGGFHLAYEDTLGELPTNVGCADLDGDGDLDLVVAEYHRALYVLLNGDPTTDVSVRASPGDPSDSMLLQNYPNPFNRETTVAFRMREAGPAEMTIYDITGKEVRRLLSGQEGAGVHRVTWDGRDAGGKEVSSGVYVVRLKTLRETEVVKILMIK